MTASCITVECDASEVKQVTTSIFMGLTSPMKHQQWSSHPISRAKAMILSSGAPFYPTCTKNCRLKAITQQRDLMAKQTRLAFINIGTLDIPFDFNHEQLTLRAILYDRLKVAGNNTIYGIVPTAPGRILISMDKAKSSATLKKLEQLFVSMGQMDPKTLHVITGYTDRPRRPNDPILVDPQV